MNDRFKFRVWDKSLKKYMEFKEFKFMSVEFTFNPITKEAEIEYDKERYIVEQCTGLKDKNGKLIYEGDIVYSPFDNGTKKVIFWDNYLARFMAYNRYPDKRFYQGISSKYFIELEFEVIGNIHENADLLENEE